MKIKIKQEKGGEKVAKDCLPREHSGSTTFSHLGIYSLQFTTETNPDSLMILIMPMPLNECMANCMLSSHDASDENKKPHL